MQKIGKLVNKYGDYNVDYVEYIRDKERKLIGCWVVVSVKNTKTTFYVGKSICNPKDVFNKKIGRAIAIGRALKLAAEANAGAVVPHYEAIKQVPAWDNACAISKEALPGYVKSKRIGNVLWGGVNEGRKYITTC